MESDEESAGMQVSVLGWTQAQCFPWSEGAPCSSYWDIFPVWNPEGRRLNRQHRSCGSQPTWSSRWLHLHVPCLLWCFCFSGKCQSQRVAPGNLSYLDSTGGHLPVCSQHFCSSFSGIGFFLFPPFNSWDTLEYLIKYVTAPDIKDRMMLKMQTACRSLGLRREIRACSRG